MTMEGYLSHQEGVMDTGEKKELVARDGGVKVAKLEARDREMSLYSRRTVWVRSMR